MNARSRIGIGFDIHRLARGRKLVLGGLEIESNVGLEGHSDADVVLHAVTDAILGACGMGDIGDHFPSSDPKWEGAASRSFLNAALDMADRAGFDLVNCDTIIVAERPHLGAWKEGIRSSLAGMLGLGIDRVCVKAKTAEGLGAVGEGRAIEAHAVVMLRKRSGKKPVKKAPARKAAKSAAKKSRK